MRTLAENRGRMSNIGQDRSTLQAYSESKEPIAIQTETLAILTGLVSGLPEQVIQRRPHPDKWSVLEIIAHLAEDELVSSWRYRQMIENSGCTLAAFNQDEWARLGDYQSWDLRDSLQMFRLLREANLRLFRNLALDEWERFGIHAERGTIRVLDLARHMAGHDRNHLAQIHSILRDEMPS
jgi:hypothetical protein